VTEPTQQAYEELLAERNRLWAELQRQRALEQEAAYWRDYAAGIERSRWWKLGKPLRILKRFREDPARTLDEAAFDLRNRNRG
jgi:hypothetical protein